MSKSGQGTFDLSADKNHARTLARVSRETEKRLDIFVDLLLGWQKKTNLVAPSTLPELWTRHIADSLQLLAWRLRRASGSTSDLAAAFQGYRLPARLRATRGLKSISLKVTEKRLLSCVKR